jgi:hypothetical protein
LQEILVVERAVHENVLVEPAGDSHPISRRRRNLADSCIAALPRHHTDGGTPRSLPSAPPVWRMLPHRPQSRTGDSRATRPICERPTSRSASGRRAALARSFPGPPLALEDRRGAPRP